MGLRRQRFASNVSSDGSAGTDGHGHARSPGDARSILAINATDAAQSHYLGR